MDVYNAACAEAFTNNLKNHLSVGDYIFDVVLTVVSLCGIIVTCWRLLVLVTWQEWQHAQQRFFLVTAVLLLIWESTMFTLQLHFVVNFTMSVSSIAWTFGIAYGALVAAISSAIAYIAFVCIVMQLQTTPHPYTEASSSYLSFSSHACAGCSSWPSAAERPGHGHCCRCCHQNNRLRGDPQSGMFSCSSVCNPCP